MPKYKTKKKRGQDKNDCKNCPNYDGSQDSVGSWVCQGCIRTKNIIE